MDVASAGNVLANTVRARQGTPLKLNVADGQGRGDAPGDGNQGLTPLRLLPRGTVALAALDGRQHSAEADGGGPGARQTQTTLIDYQRRERTALQIRTQEGDVIQLRFRAQDEAQARQTTSETTDQLINELSAALTSRSRLQISVRGELDAAELSAIQSVLNQAGALADDFFAGDLAGAFATAAAFQIDGQELARVSLRFGVQERLALAQRAVTALAPPSPVTTASELAAPAGTVELTDAAITRQPPGATAPQAALIRTDLPAPTLPATGSAAAGAESDSEAQKPAAPGLLDAIQALADLLNAVATFLNSIMAQFQGTDASANPPGGDHRMDFGLGFKLKVFQAVIGTFTEAATPADSKPGMTLLGDAVEAMAAEVQAPLQTRA